MPAGADDAAAAGLSEAAVEAAVVAEVDLDGKGSSGIRPLRLGFELKDGFGCIGKLAAAAACTADWAVWAAMLPGWPGAAGPAGITTPPDCSLFRPS